MPFAAYQCVLGWFMDSENIKTRSNNRDHLIEFFPSKTIRYKRILWSALSCIISIAIATYDAKKQLGMNLNLLENSSSSMHMYTLNAVNITYIRVNRLQWKKGQDTELELEARGFGSAWVSNKLCDFDHLCCQITHE